MARKSKKRKNPALESYRQGLAILDATPIFTHLLLHAYILRVEDTTFAKDGWARVTNRGWIYANAARTGRPEEWVYVLAHCLLHLGYEHFQSRAYPQLWNAACDYAVARFMANLKIGQAPLDMVQVLDFTAGAEKALYEALCLRGEIPKEYRGLGTAGANVCDMVFESRRWYGKPPDWQKLFAGGIATAVSDAVKRASGHEPVASADRPVLTAGRKARNWFISSYPLLGALAAGFKLIEDKLLCTRMNVRVAAVDAELQEIYLNPLIGLDEQQYRFVTAHELLHVGLCHHGRCRGRDAFLWNVACDYVINAWLLEMDVGMMPSIGSLYDPELKGLSAEAVYDRIVTDRRRFKKLATLRGAGIGDMLAGSHPAWWEIGAGISLDEFYRRSLGQGLVYHESHERGYLPAGLVEEIWALSRPPIPWDVELARWFDEHFAPLEKIRTYARLSRRQSSTPDIPRPSWAPAYGALDQRTFGVILDTSGSMDRNLLAKALGTIAGYSTARDVPLVRVVFCDATYYDQGYMTPDDIAGRVRVKGRGGTVIQPAVDMLEKDENFPQDGPLLIITDGYCDRLKIRREHAFLLPKGRSLPFPPKGKVFYIS